MVLLDAFLRSAPRITVPSTWILLRSAVSLYLRTPEEWRPSYWLPRSEWTDPLYVTAPPTQHHAAHLADALRYRLTPHAYLTEQLWVEQAAPRAIAMVEDRIHNALVRALPYPLLSAGFLHTALENCRFREIEGLCSGEDSAVPAFPALEPERLRDLADRGCLTRPNWWGGELMRVHSQLTPQRRRDGRRH